MAKRTVVSQVTPQVKLGRNVIRVQVTPKDYFNLDRMQKIQKDILGELGCLACCSDWDIRFDMQRDFIIR